ncbi:Uncharacterised protein [Vibrio cholerae]|nr:Uncharacterised protein [Vibrio cholerae]CSI83776.1 Uncharacterised protein [Vibrio cholerae]
MIELGIFLRLGRSMPMDCITRLIPMIPALIAIGSKRRASPAS